MPRKKRSFRDRPITAWVVAVGLCFLGCADSDSAILGPEDPSVQDHRVGWPRGGWVPVRTLADLTEVGRSRLGRHRRAINYVVRTTGLEHRHAYTLWILVFNAAEECQGGVPEGPLCGPMDMVNDAARPDMLWAGGGIANRMGRVAFAGRLRVGDLRRSVNDPVGLPAYGLERPAKAEVQFVVHDHGPVLFTHLPDMLTSIDGGCTDAGVPVAGVSSPWNDHEFGRRGPNTCQSVQFAVHSP